MSKSREWIPKGHYKSAIKNFLKPSNDIKIIAINLWKAMIWSFISYTFIKVDLKIPTRYYCISLVWIMVYAMRKLVLILN